MRVLAFERNGRPERCDVLPACTPRAGRSVALLDGDLQNDPADIPRLVAEIERGAGRPGLRLPPPKRKDTVVKRITSRVANFVRSRFTRDGVRDNRLLPSRPCAASAWARLVPFAGMHRFIPALVKGAGFRLMEMPVNHRPRQFGVSKYGPRATGRGARTVDMFGVRWLLSRQLRYRVASDGPTVSVNVTQP